VFCSQSNLGFVKLVISHTSLARMATTSKKCFVFVFPEAAGHVNPSLAVARALVNLGHEVHYLCCEQFRQAIEDTGATLHADSDVLTSLYEGRGKSTGEVLTALRQEHGLEQESYVESFFKLGYIQNELKIPDLLHFLQELRANAIVYCASNSCEAAWAAKILDLPSVALLSLPGPGSLPGAMRQFVSPAQLANMSSWEPSKAAADRLDAKYGLQDLFGDFEGGLGWLSHSFTTLVTTLEELQDPISAELSAFYKTKQASFSYLGPLLDQGGAVRAAGHKSNPAPEAVPSLATCLTPDDVVQRVCDARRLGRKVTYVSMGTEITGDDPQHGWEGRNVNVEKQTSGLTGRELCRAAWGAAFEAFGAQSAEEGPLLVISMGPQANALGQLVAPPNALCLPFIPQVDVLRAGVDVFLTHGGQNSFMESLAAGTPVLVCPGLGDQFANADKAVTIGVGLKVDRPEPSIGEEASAAKGYQAEIFKKLQDVMRNEDFKTTAAQFKEKMQAAGGVSEAVNLILQAVTHRDQALRIEGSTGGA